MCIPDMIWIVDLLGRFIYANLAVAHTHGEHRESFFLEQGQFKDNRPFWGLFQQLKEKFGKDLSY